LICQVQPNTHNHFCKEEEGENKKPMTKVNTNEDLQARSE